MEGRHDSGQGEGQDVPKYTTQETEPLLERRPSTASRDTQQSSKQLTTRHAFAILVSLQIGSGVFASPAQVDSNVPSPGAALLVWVVGGVLSWAGAASFAELGAALPLNGGMQEYLRHVFGNTAAFLMAWVYIMAVKPASLAIQSIVIAESIGSVSSGEPLAGWFLKLIAIVALISLILLNSINTRFTLRLSETFTLFKISTVGLVFLGGLVAVISHLINPDSSLSGAQDWYSKNWFQTRPTFSDGHTVDWTSMNSWDRYGHYCAAIYGGLWAYDGWDSANIVASEIRDPGHSLPKAIKAAMVVVLSSYELVNVAYYVLLPWDKLSANNAVAVAAASSLLGRPAGIVVTLLVAISCAGSITSNVFSVGRLTIAASQRHYLPAFFSKRGLPKFRRGGEDVTSNPTFDAPMHCANISHSYANMLALVITLVYILTGSFRALLTFVGMAEWVFYVSTVVGLLVLRRREPQLERPYRPIIVLPITFVIVGTLVIIRSAIFAPVQSGVLASLLVVGAVISKLRER
ncbi:amino acid transporter [Dothidotthia symphoricarpi CBS 119687]|uniref:Amino acid transporter n=1 Tax=Dothidotthia symphoricarpi CBS 119687 TaxID=1392245 RepID=A0A6A6A4U3_9PLEO|nr:amino acid transporter [Dothidotthia symphoricarpi CBS 119687]KAF2125917.1 amino acid transporter [Dothidotthia symphoricarpi CBS 119687]